MVGMAKAIGHEINNPLATVSGRAMLIEKEYGFWEMLISKYRKHFMNEDVERASLSITKGKDYVQRIARSAQRINIVVQTLTNLLIQYYYFWKSGTTDSGFR